MLYHFHEIFPFLRNFPKNPITTANSQKEANKLIKGGTGGEAFENVQPAPTPTNVITLLHFFTPAKIIQVIKMSGVILGRDVDPYKWTLNGLRGLQQGSSHRSAQTSSCLV